MIPGSLITREAVLPRPVEERPKAFSPNDFSRSYKDLKAEAVESFTREYLHLLLARNRGNISLSAKASGIKRQSLQKIVKRYGISIEKYRMA